MGISDSELCSHEAKKETLSARHSDTYDEVLLDLKRLPYEAESKTPKNNIKNMYKQTMPHEAKRTVTRNIIASTFTLFGSNTVLFYVPVTLRTRSSAK